MELFRIAREKYAEDLSGTGSYLYSGRWHHEGTYLIYTASNRSLAQLEYLVHVSIPHLPADLRIITIWAPDDAIQDLDMEEFPAGWDRLRPVRGTRDLGSKWAEEHTSLGLAVPSAVSRGERNVILNPLHERMSEVRLVRMEPLTYDERIRKLVENARSGA